MDGGVQIISRRMVRPAQASHRESSQHKDVHLTPWDLQPITLDYIQKGILLPKPPPAAAGGEHVVVDDLASSFARALGRFYPFAGRLAVTESSDATITVSLRCSDEGAEFVHAAAPGVTVDDITASLYVPPVVWSFFPLSGMVGADAATAYRPVLAAQVTELDDGVFLAVSLNHAAGDGTTFWHLLNTWSEINRSSHSGGEVLTPPPVLDRWFLDSCPVPIPLPFPKLEHVVRRHDCPPVRECFLAFSPESIRKLKARANAEMAGTCTATISSLQSLLAHLWRAVCRARLLAPEHKVSYGLAVGWRGRVSGIPRGYVGNAVALGLAESTAGEVTGKGLGWTAWLLNRTVASFDEAGMKESLARWWRQPRFVDRGVISEPGAAALVTGSSPRFDVYGNDFGWGRPLAVRSGPGAKVDGKATVYEGTEGAGSMALEVCIAPDALARLVADQEFMAAVTV